MARIVLSKMNKKALTLEFFMRTVLAIAAFFALLHIGRNVAEAAFGGDKELQSFNLLVERISEAPNGREPFDIRLREGSAIIGIGNWMGEYTCVSCKKSTFSPSYQLSKKAMGGCVEAQSCLCLCRGLGEEAVNNGLYALSCQKILCKPLDIDFVGEIEVKYIIERGKGPITGTRQWKNGFFYVRAKDDETPFNGLGSIDAPNKNERQPVYIEKRGKLVGLCPEKGCLIS